MNKRSATPCGRCLGRGQFKPAVVQVEAHPYLPQWEMRGSCEQHGIVLLAFAALGHGMEPKVLDDP
jgi:diketogulonate reductase-like aldo/keto reductase